MAEFDFEKINKLPKLNKPILIIGLPGIANTGKLAADFLVEEVNAKLAYEIYSSSFPNTVFVNEDDIVDMPTMQIYYKKYNDKRNDLIIIAGDIQPLDPEGCYQFCDRIVKQSSKLGCNEIITLGGIGLKKAPIKPRVFCAGSMREIITFYTKNYGVTPNIHDHVGPILGVTGQIIGIARRNHIQAVSLLAETYGHAGYLGIAGSRELINILSKRLKLKTNMKKFDAGIKKIEEMFAKKPNENSTSPISSSGKISYIQ